MINLTSEERLARVHAILDCNERSRSELEAYLKELARVLGVSLDIKAHRIFSKEERRCEASEDLDEKIPAETEKERTIVQERSKRVKLLLVSNPN